MKIKQLFAGIFFALMLCSCSQKKEENKILYPNVHAQKATFNLLLNNTISGELKEFLLKPVYKNSSFIYVIEDLYPQCTGIYDLSLFYSESCDDASWVDDLLFYMEEQNAAERIISQLETVQTETVEDFSQDKLLNDLQLESPVNVASESIEKDYSIQNELQNIEIQSVEKILKSSENRLKILEYDDEIFIPVSSQNKKVLIYSINKSTIRVFYDDDFRITKKEFWNIETAENASKEKTEEYFYNDGEDFPYKKIIKTNAVETVSVLNRNGLPENTKSYQLLENEKNLILNEINYEYNENGKIIKEINKNYNYIDNKLKNTTEKKQIFIYNSKDEEMPPDYEYYENNKLIIKTEYSSKNSYTTTVSFDNNLMVKTYYENYLKVKDVYITDGKIMREKIYE